MSFPLHRPRRLRRTETIRRMVRETHLRVDDLIAPLFVCHGEGVADPIPSMPGCHRHSIDRLVDKARQLHDLGIPGIILFGIPETKDPVGSEAYAEDGIVPRAIRALKEAVPELLVWGDVCLCEYTDHGHCGILEDGVVQNDATVPLLARTAVCYAKAGADVIAPSDMMDGRVGAIRGALDEEGFADRLIVSYAVKYCSSFYGPFRDAADSAPRSGDRRGYQMDPPNVREAITEASMDLEEGADIIMVKPALPYLDVIHRVRGTFTAPIAAYNVSGEFAMLKAAGERGWLDATGAAIESLVSIKRAGADIILTYFAEEVAGLLAE